MDSLIVSKQGYQIALSLNILALISWGWTQKTFAQKIETPMHATIIMIALVFAIVPLPIQGYNAFCGQCLWQPLYDESGNVVRGSQKLSDIYSSLFPTYVWALIVFCTYAMLSVYVSVRKQETRMKRYAVEGSDDDHYRQSKRILKTLLLYTMALYLCWLVPFTISFFARQLDAWPEAIPYSIKALREVLIPFSGWFNMLVYFLPKCLEHQRKNETWLFTSYVQVLGCGQYIHFRCRVRENEYEDAECEMNFSNFNSSDNNKHICSIEV